ncbi:hypothetical protein JS530_03155 [Bifidobacterium sp. LC6]|uniref:Uncharacterized protein n=1 Tax=Bifidobacterium colobi TaxID=2809026 RepID=A0ABS5UTY6_9BIFI|nr:hypothetical protein [Bifidobacterium colobi]MBT1174516.1 hypothetical protein [Bifidobacterium colobi]
MSIQSDSQRFLDEVKGSKPASVAKAEQGEWLVGSHRIVGEARRSRNSGFGDEIMVLLALLLFFLIAATIVAICGVGAYESVWVSDHGDNPHLDLAAIDWMWVVFFLVSLCFAVAVLFWMLSIIAQRLRWIKTRDEFSSPLFVGINTYNLPGEVVYKADSRSSEGNRYSDSYPLMYIIWRTDAEPQTIYVPAYVTKKEWEQRFNQPDPDRHWGHRHLMMMIELHVDGDRIQVVGMEPVSMQDVQHAWDGMDSVAVNPQPRCPQVFGQFDLLL